ncbi:MAG: Asp-tRNA(Asn)/Glu-tRNA(Gln) amidotransferase subunit GatC [Acidobacteria bacterium]|nr:Asp-tRNA(Asn)/Glu-tRNA(Gln) amidotransferase subunit GatC [Acidobacteriota bacterium]
MKITAQDVRYVAALASLELSDAEAAQFAADMDSILTYVEKLNELDTAAIEPMAQVLYDAPEDVAMRADGARPGFAQQKALSNAPESGAGHFKVSKVIER